MAQTQGGPSPPLAYLVDTTRRVTTAARHPGHERTVYRVQGFVFVAAFIFSLQIVSALLFRTRQVDPQVRATAWATAFLAALLYGGVVVSIDRNEKEPWQMLLVGFLWGAAVSGSIAYLLNGIWHVYAGPALVERELIESVFSIAPLTEELTKGAILFLVYRYLSDEFDDALDGIVYGALVGIGFAMVENAGYFMRHGPSTDIVSQMTTFQFFLRVELKGLAGHATYTAMTGLGLGLSRSMKGRWSRVGLPLLGLGVAMLAHALWNSDTVRAALDLSCIESDRWRIAVRVLVINGPFFLAVAQLVE